MQENVYAFWVQMVRENQRLRALSLDLWHLTKGMFACLTIVFLRKEPKTCLPMRTHKNVWGMCFKTPMNRLLTTLLKMTLRLVQKI